jgi:hypothetical protein
MTSCKINLLSKCLKVMAIQAKVMAPYPPKRNTLIYISNSNCLLFISLDSCECLQQFLQNFFFLSAPLPSGLRENLTDQQTNKTHTLQIKCGGLWLRLSNITENLIEDDEPWNNRPQFVGSKLRLLTAKWFQPSPGFVFFRTANVMHDTCKMDTHKHKRTQVTEIQVRRADLGIRSMNITTRCAFCGTVPSS